MCIYVATPVCNCLEESAYVATCILVCIIAKPLVFVVIYIIHTQCTDIVVSTYVHAKIYEVSFHMYFLLEICIHACNDNSAPFGQNAYTLNTYTVAVE